MIKKYIIFLLITLALIPAGCIKETYDMKKLSKKITLSPTLVLAASSGEVSLRDRVKQSDTIVYDSDKFMRIIYRKDSIINQRLADYFDLENMVSYRQGYQVGDLKLDDFQSSIPISLNTISSSFSPALRAQFVALNGTTSNFPPFPSTNLGEKGFTAFPNFLNAVFSAGLMEISVKNNLTAPLNNINISLFNASGHTPIGSPFTIPTVAPGATQIVTIDLTGKSLTNSIVAAIALTGSPGTTSPVLIDLNSTIVIGLRAYNLSVRSGRVILPIQEISSLDGSDVVTFTPGNNIEIEKMKVLTGNISYTLVSNSGISGTFSFSIPTSPVISRTIQINGPTTLTSTIPLNNTVADLSTDASHPFNSIPVNYTLSVNSNGAIINFNSTDSVHIDLKMLNPDFDYIKGYFGQSEEQIQVGVLETGLNDFLNNISGEFHISNPSLKLNYSNSFGIPIEVTLNVSGKRNNETVNLGLAPFLISYPTSDMVRDISATYKIDRLNSALPDLISLPPTEITFSGKAKMNPAGTSGGRNNYVFGNSRITGSLEVEVPMEFWIKNLQFADTLGNFLKTEDGDSPLKPEDIDLFQIKLVVNNGFPLGASLKLMLYNSATNQIIKTVDAKDLIKSAPVDAAGKSVGKSESTTTIDLNKDFFNGSGSADKMIIVFTLNTAENGTKDIKIYSDYSISFKASLTLKPVINL